MEVYLDNSATTRCFDEVAVLMTQIMCEDYGNPSSLHRKGVEAEKDIKRRRLEGSPGTIASPIVIGHCNDLPRLLAEHFKYS